MDRINPTEEQMRLITRYYGATDKTHDMLEAEKAKDITKTKIKMVRLAIVNATSCQFTNDDSYLRNQLKISAAKNNRSMQDELERMVKLLLTIDK